LTRISQKEKKAKIMSGKINYVMSESSQNDHGLNVKGKGNK